LSEDIRTEQDRLIAELRSLVNGLSAEVTRLHDVLRECEEHLMRLVPSKFK
jgi:hypothetical protein